MRWRPIEGTDGKYEVSDGGSVRSYYNGKPRILKAAVDKVGRPKVFLFINKKGFNFTVSRLVAQAFIANPGNLPEVNHIDNDPSNNTVQNLEWCTRDQNMAHAARQMRMPHKLTPEQVLNIRGWWGSGILSRRELSHLHQVSYQTINDITQRRIWKHVS